jgi:hypothetical protein
VRKLNWLSLMSSSLLLVAIFVPYVCCVLVVELNIRANWIDRKSLCCYETIVSAFKA